MNCHLDHQIYELFEKRFFKCDCNTPRGGCKCVLSTNVYVDNVENKYTHNFAGKYCWCDDFYDYKTYMLQCFVCEDWFHEECIKKMYNGKIPGEEYECDFVCYNCTSKYTFIRSYLDFLVTDTSISNENTVNTSISNEYTVNTSISNENTVNTSTNQISNPPSSTLNSTICKLKIFDTPLNENIFLKKEWIKNLCKCESCLALYSTLKVNFLVEEPKRGNIEIPDHPPIDLEEEALNHFDKMFDHKTKFELVLGLNNFTQELKKFLHPFATEKKVVKKRDISSFLENMNSAPNKKRRFNTFIKN